jgi:hypothetical protein
MPWERHRLLYTLTTPCERSSKSSNIRRPESWPVEAAIDARPLA